MVLQGFINKEAVDTDVASIHGWGHMWRLIIQKQSKIKLLFVLPVQLFLIQIWILCKMEIKAKYDYLHIIKAVITNWKML